VPAVYLGLGSNVDAENNLRLAVRELRSRFGDLGVSAVYRSRAVGFEGPDFLNLVVRCRTDMPALDLLARIDEIHDRAGRGRGDDRFASRPLDIDLLMYGDAVMILRPLRIPREDILEYAFVLRPLAELEPALVHPVTGRTMAQHWDEFDDRGQPLERVDLDL
jgi:2-amino-4-hydroxy-6-hydroxymethyldihydropteridine diphosphokinase